MRCAARSGNNDIDAALVGDGGKFKQPRWRAMRRHHLYFELYA
jgi:hypothetical protein